MRDFRRKDKKKEGIFLEVPSFLMIVRLTRSDKTHILLYEKAATMPRPSHKQKAHQMMGFLLVKLSIPGGNAVVTSMGQFRET